MKSGVFLHVLFDLYVQRSKSNCLKGEHEKSW